MFNIGDRVRVKAYNELPEEVRTMGNAKLCGKDAVIVDRIMSAYLGKILYRIAVAGKKGISSTFFPEDSLISLAKRTYSLEITQDDGAVYATLKEDGADGVREIAKGRGFIYDNETPAFNFAQAASYAALQVMRSLRADIEGKKEEN